MRLFIALSTQKGRDKLKKIIILDGKCSYFNSVEAKKERKKKKTYFPHQPKIQETTLHYSLTTFQSQIPYSLVEESD